MSRKKFLESVGATCKNWQWSWSFINSNEGFIVFGAWDRNTKGTKTLIFSEEWESNDHGRKNPGYSQSREHIRLIENENYKLMTFPMKYSDAKKGEDGIGPPKIDGFTPVLSERTLTNIGVDWYAVDGSEASPLAEELPAQGQYAEGAKVSVTINAYERSSAARKACITHYGLQCRACGFDFKTTYGAIGENFIHVHHIVPIGSIKEEYVIHPVDDLRPVCPNCHSMIHQVTPPLTIEKLQRLLQDNK